MLQPSFESARIGALDDRDHRARERPGVARIDEHGGVPRHLGERRAVRRDDRGAARHRLEHGEAEPLGERREHEGRGVAVERGQGVLLDVADVLDRRDAEPLPLTRQPLELGSPPGAREQQLVLGELRVHLREGLEQRGLVLVGVAPADVEEVRRAAGIGTVPSTRHEALAVDAERDGDHARRIEPEQAHRLGPRVLADREHEIAAVQPAVIALPARAADAGRRGRTRAASGRRASRPCGPPD